MYPVLLIGLLLLMGCGDSSLKAPEASPDPTAQADAAGGAEDATSEPDYPDMCALLSDELIGSVLSGATNISSGFAYRSNNPQTRAVSSATCRKDADADGVTYSLSATYWTKPADAESFQQQMDSKADAASASDGEPPQRVEGLGAAAFFHGDPHSGGAWMLADGRMWSARVSLDRRETDGDLSLALLRAIAEAAGVE